MEAPGREAGRSGWRAKAALAVLAAGAMTLSGCISVNAPDKPIVIELNINIRQEVIYRLAADAADTVEANPDIF
jgi:anti-sigma-K factor RskA